MTGLLLTAGNVDIVSLIGSLGFPIVACGAMFWKMNDQDKKHKEEMDKMSEAINNNTKALEAILAKIS